MITELQTALCSFWNSFGLPAYLTGHVPENPVFPLIVYDVQAPEYAEAVTLTATVWTRHTGTNNPNAQRAEILDAVAEAIPAMGGRLLEWDGGAAALYRGPGFLSMYDDPDTRDDENPVLGGRISYTLTLYQ